MVILHHLEHLLRAFHCYCRHMQEFEEDVRILRLLKPRLPERPVILDVGASNGRWTREIVKIFPSATVFLFEPGTAYTDEMRATLESHERLKLFPIADLDHLGFHFLDSFCSTMNLYLLERLRFVLPTSSRIPQLHSTLSRRQAVIASTPMHRPALRASK